MRLIWSGDRTGIYQVVTVAGNRGRACSRDRCWLRIRQTRRAIAYSVMTLLIVTGARWSLACGLSDAEISQSPTGAVAALAGAGEWPGLNTQGISHGRLDFAVGGVIAFHTHPRASETLLVSKGSVYTGFTSDFNVLYASILQPGDVTVFPRALLHFQLNVGIETAATFNTLKSQNPGFLRTANEIFTPNITSAVIEKSFGIDAATVKLLKGSYPGHT